MDLTFGGLGSDSTNAANRGRGGARGGGRGQGGHRGRSRNGSSPRGVGNGTPQKRGDCGFYNNNNSRVSPADDGDRPLCQVCFKKGHTADRCWHRFDEDYVPDPKLVTIATRFIHHPHQLVHRH